MRLLFWTDVLGCGGRERQLTELIKGLINLGHLDAGDITVLAMEEQGHFDREIEQAGVRIERLCRKWRWDPFVPIRGRRMLRAVRPDIICSVSVMGTFYANLTRWPRATGLMDASIRNAKPLRTAMDRALCWCNFRAADLVVANSEAGLRAKRAPLGKSAVLYNGFDFNRLGNLPSPAAVRQALGIKAARLVGMVGSFIDAKDWRSFLEAAELVRGSGQNVCFVCVGGGRNLPACQAEFGTRDHVLFTGQRSDVESLVSAFDVGVLCSNPDLAQEGIPNAVLEYMALGVPPVVTAGGGVGELVQHGETGFIVPPRSPQALAERICYLLKEHETAKAMGQRARQRVQEHFSIEIACARFMAICNSVLKG